jgi:hypothetical protein
MMLVSATRTRLGLEWASLFRRGFYKGSDYGSCYEENYGNQRFSHQSLSSTWSMT